MRRYEDTIAVIAILLFLSGADLYLFLSDQTAATPKDWLTIFGVLLLPLAAHRMARGDTINKPFGRLALWALAYIAISVIWYGLSPSTGALQELRDRCFAVCVIGAAGVAFSAQQSRRAAACATIVVVMGTAAINAVELFEPSFFVMQVPSRASGLYLNANSCGAALVLGMIIASPLVAIQLRTSFYVLVGAAVITTFSRSSIAGWLMTAAALLMVDSHSTARRQAAGGCLIAGLLLAILYLGAQPSVAVNGIVLDDNQVNRIDFFRTFEASDDAAQQRREVAAAAWEMFAARPLRGNGLASTQEWRQPISTHNMFLLSMSDHGLIGAFILPSLLMCILLSSPRAASSRHWIFCGFTIWLALFSHNILTERYQLLSFAFFAMGGVVDTRAVQNPIRAERRRLR